MGNVDSRTAAPARRRTMLPVAVAMACVAMGLAGCGGSSPGSTQTTAGNGSGGPPQQAAQAAFKYSACMRNHGVTNFPDPKVSTSPGQVRIALAAPANLSSSPHFKTARQACNSIMPQPSNANAAAQAAQQRAQTAGLLSFAKCVRDHGINGFPDPDSQGRLTLTMLQTAGVDVHAPQVLAAARTCIPASHGQVNAAAIEQAANGSGTAQTSSGGSTGG
ncbi:MAG TPA: hypothetical protein VHX62_16270 [Solirubrobacteraceae bacterium]|nr:hypothetical protein [Solirubrobacteraceae bacterium]